MFRGMLGFEMAWKFSDPENVAVVTTQAIIRGRDWIGLVTRDAADGAWQFLPITGAPDLALVSVVSLKNIVTLDASVTELADLAFGWRAWRTTKEALWQRSSAD
jgi:hypothetical protein